MSNKALSFSATKCKYKKKGIIYYIANLNHRVTLGSPSGTASRQNNYVKMTREQKNYGIVIGKSQSKSMISVTEKEQAENYKAEEW
jgi:tartrate dehydratase beta subunit/fumarate hydratase class I family protein